MQDKVMKCGVLSCKWRVLKGINMTMSRPITSTWTSNMISPSVSQCYMKQSTKVCTIYSTRTFHLSSTSSPHIYSQTNLNRNILFNSYQFRTNNSFFLRSDHLLLHGNETNYLIPRYFHAGSPLFDNKDSSKVEQTVKALKEKEKKGKENEEENLMVKLKPDVRIIDGGVEDKKIQDKGKQTPLVDSSKVGTTQTPTSTTIVPKRSLGKRVWDEIVHYYHGFRLLIIDIRITSKYIWKILNGEELNRREHRQLVRTTSDVFRLVPFSVFIIVPFMEFLLPVFLKFFPGMLPSTFLTSSDKETKIKKELKLKLEMAKFLQQTLDEMSLKATGEHHSANAKEFANFFNKIRKSGQQATNEDIMKFSKLFEDEITLDSLSRPQLVALCRLLELQPIGTNNFLRFQLRMQLRSLKADDQVIQKEGIASLTVPELQQACRARGMRALGVSEDRLRSQLQQWLELSLNENIPPSLLLLSRVLYLPENLPAIDQLAATIQTLSEDAGTQAKYKIGETEGKIDNKTKIELLRKEEAAIKREEEEELELLSKKKEKITKESVDQMIEKTEVLVARAEKIEKQKKVMLDEIVEDDKKLSKEDIDSLEDALENISDEKHRLLLEKEELEDLKEEMADYKEDIAEFKEIAVKTGNKDLKETKAAKRLRNKVDTMVNQMDKLMMNLGSKKQTLQKQMDILEKEGKEAKSERDDVIGINDLLLAIRKIQKIGDDTKLQRIIDVLDLMDVDHDGQVEIEHVVKVIELLGRENVKVSSNQMKDIIKLLIQEEKLEEAEKKRKQENEKRDKELKELNQQNEDENSSKK